MTLQHVPVVDIGPFLRGEPGAAARVAAEVARACTDIGFLVITNHGVPSALCDEMVRVSGAFFDLPIEAKRAVDRPADNVPRGYSGLEEEGLAYLQGVETPGDLKESVTIGPVDFPAADPYYRTPLAAAFFAENLWPARPAEFRAVWTRYYHALSALADRVLELFALGLGLDAGYFRPLCDRHTSCLRVINYPEVGTPRPGQLRAGAHTDYSTVTFVRHGEYSYGLQVLNRNGEWTDTPPTPDSFIVNIGDAMMQWTNNRWISTQHRVINPRVEHQGRARRTSLVFFHQPNYDARIECIATCADRDHPARYPPVLFGEYLQRRFTSQTTFTLDAPAYRDAQQP